MNIILPLVIVKLPAIRNSPSLMARTVDATGRSSAVYFDSVVRSRPDDVLSSYEGRGRFHVELWVLNLAGLKVSELTPSDRFAARFFFNALSPFVLLFGVSLLTRPPAKSLVDRFYGKMKTPVGDTPKLELAAMEATNHAPNRFDHLKLFPRSQWELTKWDRVDTIGFFVCSALSASIVGLFWVLLRLAVR